MSDEDKLIKVPGGKVEQRDPMEILVSGAADDLKDFTGSMEQTTFLVDESGSMLDRIHGHESKNKMDLLKFCLERYIRRRFQKNPKSRVSLVAFESVARELVPLTDNEKEIIAAVQKLRPKRSTRMDEGLELAIKGLHAASEDWIPRIVLISDGAPDSMEAVVDVMDQYRDTRIIIDAIYIGEVDNYNAMYVEFMKEIAQRTGGVFETINNEATFEQKFLKVAERPLLGAGNPKQEKKHGTFHL
jgi:Mg-chelatase subunit ChlD